MLTSDLVRTRIRDGCVEPEYVDSTADDVLAKADELVDIFERHADDTRGAIDAEVDRVTGYGTDYKIWRGLAKLLYDRSEFETVAPADPVELRRRVFELAEECDGRKDAEWRRDVLERAAESFDSTGRRLSETLYADLDERQRLCEFDAIEPQALIHRYNLALAQAVLYSATHLEVELRSLDPNMLRYLFHVLKFNRLMHRCRETSDGYLLTIDGPASLFKRNRKYGMRLARFLPALVLLEEWSMEATLEWEDTERTLEVDSDDELVSHYTAKGQWKAEEEAYFEEQFEDWETEWKLRREGAILQLGDNQVIVPDYVMEHPDGRVAHVEIVGFWRMSYLERRISLLEEADEIPLVLVVSEKLKTGRQELEASPASVFFFKTVILVDKVIEAAEAVASVPT